MGGLFWGMAAVHYPVWINKKASDAAQSTMWIGIFNVAILIGILIGYGVGGVADMTGFVTWRQLYALEAAVMLLCGVFTGLFSPELIQVTQLQKSNEELHKRSNGLLEEVVPIKSSEDQPLLEEGNGKKVKVRSVSQISEKEYSATAAVAAKTGNGMDKISKRKVHQSPTAMLVEKVVDVFKSKVYLWTVGTGALLAGSVGFILYFVNQYLTELDFWDTTSTYILTAVCFVISPIPGNLLGAWYVTWLGGYQNTVGATLTTFQASALSFCGCLLLALGAELRSEAIFVIAFYSLLFFGSSPTAAIGGIAVSTTSQGTYAGSGIQYALQNTGKIIIPTLGGVLVDSLGITAGFEIMLCVGSGSAVVTAMLGYHEARRLRATSTAMAAAAAAAVETTVVDLRNN